MQQNKAKLSLSVVVCAYNEEAWIGRTLASLMQQNRLPDEVIVVNNASTDSTEAVIQEFIAAHPAQKMILVNEPRRGLFRARDAGWRAAQGDIVVNTDADILFPPDWLQIVEGQFADDPDLVGIGGVVRYDDANFIANWGEWFCDRVYRPAGFIGSRLNKGELHKLAGANSAYRRWALAEVNGYTDIPPGTIEDHHVSRKIQEKGYKVRFLWHLKVWASFRRYKKDGWRGYWKYFFGWSLENVYPDHVADTFKDTITVIVPAYNEEKLLRKCLDSVARQQPPPDEIVIVDNASTDHTAEVIQKFIADYPELKGVCVYETKRGCPAAREAGWRASTGSIIIHVDADETCPPGWLASIRAMLAVYPEVGALGGTYRFENAPFSILLMQVLYNRVYIPLMERIKGFPYLTGGQTIVRREVLEKMNGYVNRPPDQLEDYYLSEQAHRLGYKLRYSRNIYGIHSLRRYEAGGLRAWLKWGVAGIDGTQYSDNTR